MLVLSRRDGEAIVIGGAIQVRILAIGKNSVRIGVAAPNDVAIHREEIYELLREDGADSSSLEKLASGSKRTAVA